MSEIKQVKVDNWGIYFLQRLKHFFNRTDYCDLTLQFQDNAQLKVHRLVLNACTEYFELLERTCEMYEDCLVMPDDLQADVVVPIVNFMYTGQLGFKPELLERLYQTSQVMNMPVLTKLLDAHRNQMQRTAHDYRNIKSYSKTFDLSRHSKPSEVASTSYMSSKRSYSQAFDSSAVASKSKKQIVEKIYKPDHLSSNEVHQSISPCSQTEATEYPVINKKKSLSNPRPTRYELPEELDGENVFDNSFTTISYTSKPLMVHPETVKRYSSKKNNIFDEACNTKRFLHGPSTVDIVECKKISNNENIFDDVSENIHDDIFPSISSKDGQKDSNQLFDLILENDTQKSTMEIKDSELKKPKLDHAKIISDVLKKYPHLVKSNKNIKLKILNTSSKLKKPKSMSVFTEVKDLRSKADTDFSYEVDVLETKEAAKLIAMGVDNIKGPWICLICGTPGRAIHFTSYYKFRRHLVEVHNEKPIPNICEYCGLKSLKRNYALHHLYTKHGVQPPGQYHFPKCNQCNYIALTEAFLLKHKLTHVDNRKFGCNVCAASFNSSTQLLIHIQKTGHKYSAERKTILHCIYCLKTFSRETNLYTHLKIHHKQSAQSDRIIDESEDETEENRLRSGKSDIIKSLSVKYDLPMSFDNEFENIDIQYQIQQKPDGNIHVLTKSPQTSLPAKHKILNPAFNSPSKSPQNSKPPANSVNKQELLRESTMTSVNRERDEIVMIDGDEYIVKDNHLVPRNQNTSNQEYLLSNVIAEQTDGNSIPTTSIGFPIIHHSNNEESKIIIKKAHMNQPIQIVVSNEEEYKALMSSNHSIIFEEGDPSKTLTVLTAPQNSTLEGSTIDLDHAQSNDMMILQENFPLNAAETVTADNSNIVVVYSHPVDDQNKQFQYITSQGIEAQFIQSSAMIAHNYETVTTSTPVMSAHALNTHIEESWQNSIKHEGIPIESQLQQQVDNVQQSIVNSQNSSDNIHSIQELPFTNIDPSVITTVVNSSTDTITQPHLENTNNTIAINIDQVLIQEVNSMPAINLHITEPNEQLVSKEIQAHISSEENSNQIDIIRNVASKNSEESSKDMENLVDFKQKVEEIDINEDVNISVVQNENVSEQNLIPEEAIMANDSSIVEVPINNIKVTIQEVAKEQLPDLTADWSVNENIKVITDTIDTNITPSRCVDDESPVYLEESIENIQQEMEKQLKVITTAITTEQYSEPQVAVSAIQPHLETESIEKELAPETTVNTSLSQVESAMDTAETNANTFILSNEKPNPAPETPTSIINDETLNNNTENVESTREEISPDFGITDTKSVLINAENVNVDSGIPDESIKEEELSSKTEVEIENNTSLSQENLLNNVETPITTLNKKAYDKISTLLNDWEDNEPQEESDTINESEFHPTNVIMKDVIEDTVEEKDPGKIIECKSDNIRSLVSDWDDDDDDDEKK